ncbi:centrosome-associated protein ALMS1 isoform X2 [Microcebus murinus]|uniref:centrosome-associated protein ALMS1 isoform X2 n=1 Tax=Microcebus murinus TaxID=30608 RepID=UPI003F6AFD11
MEPEDLPWPGELEEEEEEEEAAAAAKATNSDAAEAVGEVGEEAGKLDSDFNYGYHHLESTDDDDEDEEAKAWLQAHPGGPLPPPSPSAKYGYSEGEQPSPGKRIESWHCLPQEMDSSLTLATPQTEFSATAEGTEVTDFPSVEEGVLTQSENQVKAPTRNLLCSPLLVIQDSFASPDLPLLTCPSQDQEFGSDSLFHQSELGFAPLRGIPDRSEDTEWLSRPSEVSEALFQATSEVTSDLSNSCFSVSQHTLRGSTAVGSQRSLQGNNEEAISSGTVDELKTPNVSDSYGAPSSYMSWKTQKDTQQPEINLTDKDEVSISTSSDITDGNIDTKRSSNFDASCSHSQYWTQGVLQPEETYLISKDHDSFFDSCETIDKSKIPQESNNFSVPFTCVPWNNEGTPHHPETCVISKDCASFPHEVAPHDDKMSFSFLRRLFGRRGKGVPLTSDSVCLRAPAENEVQQQMDSLGDYEKDEDDLLEELSQYFEQTQTKNNLISSEVQPRSAQKQYIGNVVVPDNTVKVAEAHILSRGRDTSKMEPSAGLHQTVKSHLDETSEQLYFQEEGKQRATSVFGEKNVDATENVAFEAVIASIEPSKKESTVNEIQTDINKSLTDDSQEREPKYSDFSPLNYNDENSFFDELKHPRYQSTPGVFEPETSKPLLHKKDDDDSSLYQHPNLKSPPYTPQEMFSKPLPVITELKSSAALSEKSYNQAVGLGKTQSALFQYDINNEPFLPVGKIKSVPALGLAEKVGSSDINYYMKVSTSDSLVLQDLKQPTFEEVADSSNYNLGKDVNSSNAIEGPPTAVGSSFSANLVAYGAESQGALPLTSDASIAFGQETLLKADIGQGEIPRLVGAVSHFTIHTIMQNDSYFVEGLQGKTESDVITPAAAAERYSLYENVVGGERAEVPRKAGLSNLRVNRPFPSFVPHEPTRGSEYHSSTLRMLRVSPDALPKTLQHLTGDTTKGGIAEITQSNLKSGITTTPGDSDTLSHLSLSPEDLSQSAVSSPQDNTIGQHTDTLKQKTLADTHLTEETLKVSAIPEPTDQKTRTPTVPSSSYSHRGKPNIFYRQGLPDSHLTEEALKVLGVPGPADQKTGIPTITSTSHSHRGKPVIFYQQGLTGSPIPEEALKVSAVSGPADQKTRIAPVPSTPYSHRERPGTFYQQELLDIKQTEEALKVSAVSGPADQKTRTAPVPSTPYSHRERPGTFYQQELLDIKQTEEALKVSAVSGPADQKTRTAPVPSTPYSHRERPGTFYQQELLDIKQTEEALKVSAVSGPADQKTRTAPVPSTPYSHRERPGTFYQQELLDIKQTEEALKVSAVSGPADQKTRTAPVPSTPYSHRERPGTFYQQELLDIKQTEEALKVPAVSGPADQKTRTAPVPSTPYSHRERPGTFYQQELLDFKQTEEVLKVPAVSGPADQKTRTAPVPSTPYSHRERPGTFYQQELLDIKQTEEALKVPAVSGPADQKTRTAPVPSTSYSHRERPGTFYQQELLDIKQTEEALKVSAVSGPADQKTRTAPVPSTSYSYRERPSVFYQQELPDVKQTKEALKVSAVSGPANQKTRAAPVPSTSYSYRERPNVFYQQELPGVKQTQEALKVSGAPGPADYKTAIPAVPSSSYSQREKPGIFYQQALPDSHLPKEALKVSAAPGPAIQTTGIPTVTSTSYSQREKPGIFYHQILVDSHLPKEDQKVLAAPGPADHKTGIPPTVISTPYSDREKPGIFYHQILVDSHLPKEDQKVLAAPGPADHKTGIPPTVISTPYSDREKPGIFYQQILVDSHLPKEDQKVLAAPGPADHKTGIPPTVISTSYSDREKPGIFYQQALAGSHIPEEALRVSFVPGPVDQTTGIATVTSTSKSQHREKPGVFYQQDLPGSHLAEEAQKVLVVSGPADQTSGIPTVTSTSYSHREKPGIFYQQVLPGSHIPKETLRVPFAPSPADQKTGRPTVTSASNLHREKPIIFYQEALPDTHLPEKAQKVSPSLGSADQKTDIPTAASPSYSPIEKPIIFYQQTLSDSHPTEEAQKVSFVSGPADQKTGIPTVTSTPYPQREKLGIFYQQGLPGSHLTEEALKVSAVPESTDQKTGTPTVSPTSYSLGDKSIIFYPQVLPDSHLTEEALKVSVVSGPADQKTGIPTVSPVSYSLGEKPIIFYQQTLSDSQLSKESLKVLGVAGPVDQKTGIPPVTYSSYSQREKPIISYQQELPDSLLTKKALKVSNVPEPAGQKTGIPTVTSTSYSHRERPGVSYQQDLPEFDEEALILSGIASGVDQRNVIRIVPSGSYSHNGKPIISYQQELPNYTEEALKVLVVPGTADQKTGIQIVPSTSYSQGEQSIIYQQELPDLTEVALKSFGVSGPADQKTEIQKASSSSYSHREKPSIYPQQEFPDSHLTDEALKASAVFVPAEQDTGIPTGIPNYYSPQEKLKISAVNALDVQKTELPTTTPSSYSYEETPRISTVIGPDDQKTPLLTVFRSPYSQRVKPAILLQQQLPDGDQSESILKISTVPEPTDVKPVPLPAGKPVPLSSSSFQREKPTIFYPQELPDTHLTEDTLKLSTVPGSADQKTVLPVVSPSSFSLREKSNIFYQKDLPDRHVTEDALKFSGGPGQADQITGLQTVPSDAYSDGEKHKLVSKHVQRQINNLNSSDSSVSSNNMPLNSQADGKVVINKPESAGLVDVGSEEIRDAENSSKTLKEIQTLLMEAENIALKRCNFPAPLVPFRDVGDISFVQSKKVVCFKEPSMTDVCNGDLLQRQPYTEESPNNRCMQKDIGTQTNLKCQKGIENWEFISATTVRSPLQEAECKASMALEETLRKYEAAKSVMRSEPEGYNRTIGNKIIIPMMTIIKSDSSSDISDGNGSYSWDSNLPESLESVSDVLLNFFPYVTPKTSITDSREEEGMSESEDGGGSSIDSLAGHVKNLLKCESSLNHAKQILRNAEEEECRVRARAWNMKFNLAHDYGYSISELNEDDRRKVEEIKSKLFGHGRTTDLSKDLQSPRGIGCKPEAVCSHIIIESHEKGCFRTLTAAEQSQLDSHTCVFRSSDPSEMIRGRRSPSSWKDGHINLSTSLDQNNPHLKVWNSVQLQSHSPFQEFVSDDFKISKGLRMPFHEKMNAFVPPKEVDFHSSSQMPPPEPTKKFTTSITFSSHRHSKCISDSSMLKVGVSEGSQCTGASVGVFNSHFTEEQNPPRDLSQKTSSPSSFKTHSHSSDKDVTILAEGSRKSQKLPVNFKHSHKEEKCLERSDFKGSHSEPSASANCSNFKEVQFSDNHTLISMGRPSSTLGVKQKNVTITPDIPSSIFLEQRELFEQSRAPHADHHVRKQHSPPQCQDYYVAPILPSCVLLEQRELFEQSRAPHADHHVRKQHSPPQCQDYYVAPILPSCVLLEQRELFEHTVAPHVDHQLRENYFLLSQGQDYIASDLPSPIFLEQRQSKAPCIDNYMKKHHFPFPQGQDSVVEKNDQHKPKSHASNMISVEAKFSNVSQSPPDYCTLETSASTPPSNRKALSCVRITLCPKTPSKLDSGTLDKRFHSLDAASKTRMNSEFNFDLQPISSRSLEPTSKLLTSKPIAQDQECLGFLGHKSTLDFQVVQSSLPDSNTVTQDLKTIPSQNRQIVTSRQTQVNISDLEGYSNPEGTPISADRSSQKIKTPCSAFPGKLSSDAVTQITTESPEKAIFSSQIFINAEDRGREIPESSSQKLNKAPIKFASSSAVQHLTFPRGTDGQPLLLPYKPSGSTKMYYVPQLGKIPPSMDSTSDTTIESSHSGSNDAIAPDFPAQVLGTRDDDLSATVNIKHKEGIYSKRATSKAFLPVGKKPLQKDNADASVQVAIIGDEDLSNKKQKEEIISTSEVTKVAQPEEKESLQKDTADSSDVTAAEHSAQVQDTKIKDLPDTKAIKQKEKIHSKTTVPMQAWPEDEKSLQIDIEEAECRSEFENTTHSVFRSAKFYIHHPVHPPSDQDGQESLGRSVFVRHSWKDFFQHHPGKHREHARLPSFENADKTKTDHARIKSLSINVNLANKEVVHTPKSQGKDHPQHNRQISDPKKDHEVTPELKTPHTVCLNELWNKYKERQRQQKPSELSDKKELSLVERLDRLAKILQNPITYSLQASESTQDDSRGERGAKEWSSRQQQRHKLLKKKRYKSLEKSRKNTGDLKKNKVLSTHQAGRSNQIKIEQIKFDKYILRKQPNFNYISNTSSDSRPSEESELLTDTPTNILSTTSVESDVLTQTDGEVALHERSSSISTIDTARLIQAFGHDRVCLSPRRIKLYSSVTNQQRRYLERRSKHNIKALNTGHPLMTSEHTRRHIQVAKRVISSDSISSSANSFLSSNSTMCNKQNVRMLNKAIQAGNLEIVNGTKKHTRDVGLTFPTPSSSKARLEEDSDMTSWSEEKIEEKVLFTSYPEDKKLKKNKQISYEGVSWFVPVENMKSGSKKENVPEIFGPGISWFEPITKTKPWREPLREQNWQGQRMDCPESLADPGKEPPKPFVRATLQEALQLHRPDFISRSGERIKRLKLIVQERKLQNILQNEREELFNSERLWPGSRNPVHRLPKRVFLAVQKNRPIGRKEMIQRSKRIYEQLPEVRKRREEEKRRSEYKSYRLRAQLYKTKVTNQLLGRKVPWD